MLQRNRLQKCHKSVGSERKKQMLSQEQIVKICSENQYLYPRWIPNKGWCALHRYIHTWGLVMEISECEIGGRYCYEDYMDALLDLYTWNGEGDPQRNWIKIKSREREEFNPNFIKDTIRIVIND